MRFYVQALDTNSDGYITKTELVTASIRSGRRLSKVEVEAAFKEYDKNKVKKNIINMFYCTWCQDNKLSYNEFCSMMNKRRVSTSETGSGSGSRRGSDVQSDHGHGGRKYQVS